MIPIFDFYCRCDQFFILKFILLNYYWSFSNSFNKNCNTTATEPFESHTPYRYMNNSVLRSPCIQFFLLIFVSKINVGRHWLIDRLFDYRLGQRSIWLQQAFFCVQLPVLDFTSIRGLCCFGFSGFLYRFCRCNMFFLFTICFFVFSGALWWLCFTVLAPPPLTERKV